MTDATFRELYSRYRDSLFRFGYRLTGSAETAEDMVHDVFVGLYRGNFDAARASASTYLFAGVRNQARKRLRDFDVAEDADVELMDDATGPLESLLAVESADQVRRAVAALPFAQREAVILFEYEELPLEEIAKIADTKVGTVKARLYRAREGLRRSLMQREREVSR